MKQAFESCDRGALAETSVDLAALLCGSVTASHRRFAFGGLAISGVPATELNRACVTRDEAPDTIENVIGTARAKGVGLSCVIGVNDQDAQRRLLRAGARTAGTLDFMKRGTNCASEVPDRFTLRWLRESDTAAACRIIADAFSLAEYECQAAWPDDVFGRDDIEFLACEENGEPVAGGWFVRSGNRIGIYFFGTRPSHRGKGAATALMLAAFERYRSRGVDVFTLAAGEGRQRLYRRLGFRTRTQGQLFTYDPSDEGDTCLAA